MTTLRTSKRAVLLSWLAWCLGMKNHVITGKAVFPLTTKMNVHATSAEAFRKPRVKLPDWRKALRNAQNPFEHLQFIY